MPNEISSEQILINRIMQTLPEIKEKKSHTIKNGESLWKIAKQELGDEKAKNKDIRDYVLLIAKLNKMTTLEEMNNIQANDKILLPNLTQKINTKQAKRTDFEKSLDKVIDLLINDSTIKIRKSNNASGKLFHIFRTKEYPSGFVSDFSPLLSFEVNENGSFDRISFDDLKNILKTGYDYEISKDGNVSLNKYPHKTIQKLSDKDKKALFNQLQIQFENYKKDPKPYYL